MKILLRGDDGEFYEISVNDAAEMLRQLWDAGYVVDAPVNAPGGDA